MKHTPGNRDPPATQEFPLLVNIYSSNQTSSISGEKKYEYQ
jgi:hypothetical protein